jgi:hypothetical protein
MLYNIHINQKAIIDNNWEELDIDHAVIFDAMHKIFTTFKKIEKIVDSGGEWFWLDYNKLSEQLPLLRIKSKDRLREKVKLLAKYGLIEINPNNKALGRTYFRMGMNSSLMFSTGEQTIQPKPTDNSKHPGQFQAVDLGNFRRTPGQFQADNNKQNIITKDNDILDIKNNPIFEPARKLKFENLTDEEIDLSILLYRNDYPKASLASLINFLSDQSDRKKKSIKYDNPSKNKIPKEISMSQYEGESLEDFEARCDQREAEIDEKYVIHVKRSYRRQNNGNSAINMIQSLKNDQNLYA